MSSVDQSGSGYAHFEFDGQYDYLGGQNTTAIIMGWWRPTNVSGSLVAGARLWQSGDTFCSLHTTPSQFFFNVDYTTTNYTGNSTSNIFFDSQWVFIALVFYVDNDNVHVRRTFYGTKSILPTGLILTQTSAPSGTFVPSSTFTIGGSTTTSNVDFVGQISNVVCVYRKVDTLTRPVAMASVNDWGIQTIRSVYSFGYIPNNLFYGTQESQFSFTTQTVIRHFPLNSIYDGKHVCYQHTIGPVNKTQVILSTNTTNQREYSNIEIETTRPDRIFDFNQNPNHILTRI